ncbi:MAG: 3-hydroxyacyl-CoA dehydrogenase family protein [Acutalibacteraceae bacterium]
MIIRTVTVIGATGTMGANVAGIFASFGNAKVYMVGRDIEKVKGTIPKTVKSVRADSISENLVPADFSMLEDCVKESDLVFESVAENIEIKRSIALRVGAVLKKDAISCTGSSGLSVTELAECYPVELRGNFFGIHMFNPPYSMSLCEFIATKYSRPELKKDLKAYLHNVLYRTVVEVKDSPAFLGNRIGFQFINEALQYAEKYKDNGGIDYIDAILGQFTGRSMPPLVTSDFVGLDVHKAIVENVFKNAPDCEQTTFVFPVFAQKLVGEGKLGRKSNGGLYRTIKDDSCFKRSAVYDIASGSYRDKMDYVFPFAENMKKNIRVGNYIKALEILVGNQSQEAEICMHFLLSYIVYSLYSADKIGYGVEAADDVMATGFNWCPPLALIEGIASVTDVKALVDERLDRKLLEQIDLDRIWSEVKPSKYDYRLYFKSGC